MFDLDDSGKIVRVSKGGSDTYAMVGLSYFSAPDAKRLARFMHDAYKEPGHEQLFWDDVVNNHIVELDLSIRPVAARQIAELDSVAELAAFDHGYEYLLRS